MLEKKEIGRDGLHITVRKDDVDGYFESIVLAASLVVVAGLVKMDQVYQAIALGMVVLAGIRWRKGRKVVQECVIVVPKVGVQLETRYRNGTVKKDFIHHVHGVILNEGLSWWSVVTYLALIVPERGRLVLLFPELRPRMKEMVEIFRLLDPILNDEEG